jgi:signal transduction histidine kinase
MKETTLILNDTVSPNRNPEIEKEKINLNKSIFDVLQTLNPPIQKSKIEVINTVPFDFIICGIRKYIDSILMNLISNSIQFLSQDRPPKIHISAERQDEYSVFIVEDNGLGMDIKKHGDRIFEMYKTFHSQNQSKGLGFFVIKNHVDEMGGKIEIESDLDQGMKVKVYLTNE